MIISEMLSQATETPVKIATDDVIVSESPSYHGQTHFIVIQYAHYNVLSVTSVQYHCHAQSTDLKITNEPISNGLSQGGRERGEGGEKVLNSKQDTLLQYLHLRMIRGYTDIELYRC